VKTAIRRSQSSSPMSRGSQPILVKHLATCLTLRADIVGEIFGSCAQHSLFQEVAKVQNPINVEGRIAKDGTLRR